MKNGGIVQFIEQENIAIVTMAEREHRNTFTKRLVDALKEVFEAINKNPRVKVVILQGYDNYFCCGGTKEWLLGIVDGKSSFEDLMFYDLLLRCEVPVISAMQGHALGGGLTFGCYADIIIMAEECIYSASFMKYGFTPGMGASYIIPKKLGETLGNEMLFTANNYFGTELKKRGAPVRIENKKNVVKVAIEIARSMAEKSPVSLRLLKEHSIRQIRDEVPAVVKRELEMHGITLKQPDVRERIESLFDA